MSEHEPQKLQQLIGEFQEAVFSIDQQNIHPLPDVSGQVKHEGKYIRPSIPLPPGYYTDAARLHASEGDPAQGLAFHVQPGSRLGREDSHNAVFFGSLWYIHQSGREERVQVAVKPVPSERREALFGELAALQYLGKLALPTFKTSGIHVAEAGHSHLLTYFDGPVATMDTVDWRQMSVEESWDQLRLAVDTMVLLHKNMLFHTDLYFRNVGFNERGQPVIVDPEHMVSGLTYYRELVTAGPILSSSQQAAFGRLVRLMKQEFSKVCHSTEQEVLPRLALRQRPRDGSARFKLYKKYIFDPYRQSLDGLESPIREILMRVYDEMLSQKKLEAKEGAI